MRLKYRSTDREGVSVHIDELVPYVYTPTMFGGRRQWLRSVAMTSRCQDTIFHVPSSADACGMISCPITV